MIEKVISGGQMGVDIAALRAAKHCGVPTGGWMPMDWITLHGPKPEYEKLYGMQEIKSEYGYPARTRKNVEDSDGTLRLAYNFNSFGELATLRELKRTGKPHLDVKIGALNGRWPYISTPGDAVREWLRKNKIKVLNVAGNTSERYEPVVYDFLVVLFRSLGFRNE